LPDQLSLPLIAAAAYGSAASFFDSF